MAENRSAPLMTMKTKPTTVHGSNRLATSDTGTVRMVQLSRRRSNITARPKKRHKAQT